MKSSWFVFVLVFSAGLGSGIGALWAADWTTANPVGPPTVPPSSFEATPVYNPAYGSYFDPVGWYGNMVVTGNVTGARHFRGIVPYRSVSEFTSPLGSANLSSFLRDSAQSYPIDYASGSASPYYLPSQTVTTLGGGGSLAAPQITAGGAAQTQQMAAPELELSAEQQTVYRKFRPASFLPDELEGLLSKDYQSQQPTESPSAVTEQQIAELREGLAEAKKKAQEIDKKIKDMLPGFPEPVMPEDYVLKPPEPQQPAELSTQTQQKPPDVFQQMLQQTEQQQQQQTREQTPRTGQTADQPGRQQPAMGGEPNLPVLETPFARAVLGLKKSFVSEKQDKFNQYLRIAQDYIKKGRYYRAADAYTVASTYEPNNPLGYAGKAYALLAAGEYLSSAIFLAKAIELFPALTKFQIDVAEMVGSRDLFENRVIDIVKWQKQSGSPELQFLLAYLLYNTGRVTVAKQAVDAAYEKMQDVKAVAVLKQAIDDAVNRSAKP
jgi:tetratricopeptide (TPR) repeat protein